MEATIYFQKQRDDSYTHTEKIGGVSVTQVIPTDTVTLSSFNTNEVQFALVDYEYIPSGEVKEPYKNEWLDEHGDEEYVPDELMLESHELVLTIGCKFIPTPILHRTPNNITIEINRFVNYLRCGGEFMVLIEECGLGRRNVRFNSYDDDAKLYHQHVVIDGEDKYEDVLQFKVSLKVNDPKYIVTKKARIFDDDPQILV